MGNETHVIDKINEFLSVMTRNTFDNAYWGLA